MLKVFMTVFSNYKYCFIYYCIYLTNFYIYMNKYTDDKYSVYIYKAKFEYIVKKIYF